MNTPTDEAEVLLLKLFNMVDSGNYDRRTFYQVQEYLDIAGYLPEPEDK